MSYADPAQPTGNAALLGACRRMLRPLVGLLTRRGVTFPVLADMLRGLYVDVAGNDLLSDPKSRSDSRISLMTGVHRKEIRRLRDQPAEPVDEPESLGVASQVIARWVASAARDAPPVLPRAGANSFESLVEAVTTDIRSRVVLDEFLARGLIEIDADDRVRLSQAAYLPAPGTDAQAFFLGRNLHDHVAAGSANILASGAAPFLDRAAHYDRLSPAVAQLIEAEARAIARRALEQLNLFAQAAIDAAANETAEERSAPDQAVARVNMGVYVYRDDASG